MSHRRRRHTGPPRCHTCREPVISLLLRGKFRTFNPRPVDGRTHVGAHAHPVEGKYAWSSLRELVEDLMVRREVGRDDAEREAYDMPWFARHTCHPRTTAEPTSEGAAP